jgi:clathrin heavy chain
VAQGEQGRFGGQQDIGKQLTY